FSAHRSRFSYMEQSGYSRWAGTSPRFFTQGVLTVSSSFPVSISISVINLFAHGALQQFRALQQFFQQADGLGVVVPVGQALVDGEAQLHGLPHLRAAVGAEEGGAL